MMSIYQREEARIFAVIEKVFGIERKMLEGRRGPERLCMVRFIAMRLLRDIPMTLESVGAVLGGRDHSCIIYGIDQLDNLLEQGDRRVSRGYAECLELLQRENVEVLS